MTRKLSAVLLLAACQGNSIQHAPDAAPDAHVVVPPDAPRDAAPGPGPSLTCAPSTAPTSDLCLCTANIVCDQIYYCLTASELSAKPPDWSPKASCVEALRSDCAEDMASDPVAYFPTDFRACIADLGTAACTSFGTFASVAGNFPASCQGLRSLDTGLGIATQ